MAAAFILLLVINTPYFGQAVALIGENYFQFFLRARAVSFQFYRRVIGFTFCVNIVTVLLAGFECSRLILLIYW